MKFSNRDIIRLLTKQAFVMFIILASWYALFRILGIFVDFYALKTSLGQMTSDDFSYLVYQVLLVFQTFVHVFFGVVILFVGVRFGFKTYDMYKLLYSKEELKNKEKE